MKKRWLIALIVLLVAGLTAGLLYFNVLNKKHRNPAHEQGIAVSPSELYTSLYLESKTNLLNKTLEVTGTITKLEGQDSAAVCLLAVPENGNAAIRIAFQPGTRDALARFSSGNTITVKGICTGVLADTLMDDLVSVDIQLRDGVVVE